MDRDAYTVSSMLNSINQTMQHGGKVQLKRDVGNGIAMDTSEKDIAYLDTQSKIKASTEKVLQLNAEQKLEWIAARRAKANTYFHQGEYAKASDSYLEALAGLDFGKTAEERQHVERMIQNPITCNLVACMLKLEHWTKAVQMCNLVLANEPSNIKCLRQRAKAYTKLERFQDARNDLEKVLSFEGHEENQFKSVQQQIGSVKREEVLCKQRVSNKKNFEKNMMKRMGSLYADKKSIVQTPRTSQDYRAWSIRGAVYFVWEILSLCFKKRK
ncbi:hypothetical protein THRCLA_11350 [Thraustotheca clavata]|uniref:Uncharacterized protein n=1 Tax=Thraustotheca clavata TaxID=74557 RepID=A0A1V9Y7Y8_9STRA|nr:hypothetical protein THRCLA_11350 [Thraustotheca clavata]